MQVVLLEKFQIKHKLLKNSFQRFFISNFTQVVIGFYTNPNDFNTM